MLAFVIALILFLIGNAFLVRAYKDILSQSNMKQKYKVCLAVIIAIFSVIAFAMGWFIGSVI